MSIPLQKAGAESLKAYFRLGGTAPEMSTKHLVDISGPCPQNESKLLYEHKSTSKLWPKNRSPQTLFLKQQHRSSKMLQVG